MAHDPPGTTYKINQNRIDTEYLRNKLKVKGFQVKKSFNEKYHHVEKFFKDRGVDLGKIREHSAKVITTGALTGTLLFAPPTGIKGINSPITISKNVADAATTRSGEP